MQGSGPVCLRNMLARHNGSMSAVMRETFTMYVHAVRALLQAVRDERVQLLSDALAHSKTLQAPGSGIMLLAP